MRLIALIGLIILISLPSAALAQQPNEDGVFVDPDSPTSKEYAVPTEEARRDASGGGTGGGGGSGSQDGGDGAPLFGVGVDSKGGQASAHGDGGSDARRATKGAAASSSGPASAVTESASNVSGASDDGPSTGIISGAIALLVLIVGGGIAFALRRRDGWSFPIGGRAS